MKNQELMREISVAERYVINCEEFTEYKQYCREIIAEISETKSKDAIEDLQAEKLNYLEYMLCLKQENNSIDKALITEEIEELFTSELSATMQYEQLIQLLDLSLSEEQKTLLFNLCTDLNRSSEDLYMFSELLSEILTSRQANRINENEFCF